MNKCFESRYDDDGIDTGGQWRTVRARLVANGQQDSAFASLSAFDVETGARICTVWANADENKFPANSIRVIYTAADVADLIAAAQTNVGAITDSADGTQMHARAVAGKRLVAHRHGWDATANGRQGCCVVSVRVEGQYIDRAAIGLPSTADAAAFAADVRAALAAA